MYSLSTIRTLFPFRLIYVFIYPYSCMLCSFPLLWLSLPPWSVSFCLETNHSKVQRLENNHLLTIPCIGSLCSAEWHSCLGSLKWGSLDFFTILVPKPAKERASFQCISAFQASGSCLLTSHWAKPSHRANPNFQDGERNYRLMGLQQGHIVKGSIPALSKRYPDM